MQKHETVVFPEETYVWIVSLDGTLMAFEAARKCNMDVNG